MWHKDLAAMYPPHCLVLTVSHQPHKKVLCYTILNCATQRLCNTILECTIFWTAQYRSCITFGLRNTEAMLHTFGLRNTVAVLHTFGLRNTKAVLRTFGLGNTEAV